MADQDNFEDDVWSEPVLDDTDQWEDIASPTDDEPAWEEPAWEPPDWEAPAAAPPPRVRKRRIVVGVVFLVLGMIGVLTDAFEVDVEVATAVAALIGAVTLLAGLIASERRRRQIVQLS